MKKLFLPHTCTKSHLLCSTNTTGHKYCKYQCTSSPQMLLILMFCFLASKIKEISELPQNLAMTIADDLMYGRVVDKVDTLIFFCSGSPLDKAETCFLFLEPPGIREAPSLCSSSELRYLGKCSSPKLPQDGGEQHLIRQRKKKYQCYRS